MAPPDVLNLGGRDEGWHGARLRRAIEARGLAVARLPFEACGFAVGDGLPSLRLGDLAGLPCLAIVRFIPAGSFEQVTDGFEANTNLEVRTGDLGGVKAIPVTNSGDAKRPFAVDGQ